MQHPFHSGELAVQQRSGEQAIATRNGAVIGNKIPKGAINFIAQQSIVAIASLNPKGSVWVSLLFGSPGFIEACSETQVKIDRSKILDNQHDAVWQNLAKNPNIGILIIDLNARRRLRINGNVTQVSENQLILNVTQAFPNCPKYIQRRKVTVTQEGLTNKISPPTTGVSLTDDQRQLIEESDSVFVGSAHANLSADASYRGGNPGFIRALSSNRLLIPDFKGNSMYNTLGNIEAYCFAGLAFIDFKKSRVLQLSGAANIIWNAEDEKNFSGGTRRFWQLDIHHWQQTSLPDALHWEFFDYSPHNPIT